MRLEKPPKQETVDGILEWNAFAVLIDDTDKESDFFSEQTTGPLGDITLDGFKMSDVLVIYWLNESTMICRSDDIELIDKRLYEMIWEL